ncbi:multifunctional 2',3'-cyclic-nucleotide 2'-phosphodiesterase/5'-nucleotidase/3'-nucleotidase, partial [bacterium]
MDIIMRLTLLTLLLLSCLVFPLHAETYSVVICNTNDIHGGIDSSQANFMNPEFPPQLGGGASAATLIRYLRQMAKEQGKGFLLLDTGDIFQGTLVGTKSEGEAVMRFMNEVGYDCWVPGNHEFDLGRQVTERLMQQATFPTLSANIIDSSDGTAKLFAQPYLIKDFSKLKIGIIGLTTSGTERASFEENIRGLSWLPETTTLAAYRDSLRQMGVDIIVA